AIAARAEFDLQRRDDGPRNILLDSEHILELAVVCIRPQLVPIAGAHELRRDANAVAAAPDAPLEYGTDVQLAADLVHVDLPALELERRRPCGHPDSFDAAQGGDQFVSQAVAEVLLISVRTQIGKGKHRRGRGGRRSRRAATETDR